MSTESKLQELERKTDRDLVILVRRSLAQGLALANVEASDGSPLYARAQRTYELVYTLLPLISGLDREERRELELELEELWEALDRLASPSMQRQFASASSA